MHMWKSGTTFTVGPNKINTMFSFSNDFFWVAPFRGSSAKGETNYWRIYCNHYLTRFSDQLAQLGHMWGGGSAFHVGGQLSKEAHAAGRLQFWRVWNIELAFTSSWQLLIPSIFLWQ